MPPSPAVGCLAGRVVVVTGGNRGLGLGIVHGVTAAGAAVAIWARDEARNAESVAAVEANGQQAIAISVDVADEDGVADALARTVDRFGRVDALFANAGITGRAVPFLEMQLDDWRTILRVNVEGSFLCLRATARQLVEQGEGGALVGISSIAQRYGAPGKVAYAATKTAISSVMRSLAVELAPHRIRCNTLSPGWVDTDMLGPGSAYAGDDAVQLRRWTARRTPLQRWGRPDDFGRVAAFLADPRVAFHTGDDVVVDGGYTVA